MAAFAALEYSPTLLASPSLITAAAVLDHDLRKRDVETCGWVSGDAGNPLTCPAGYSCTRIAAGFRNTAGVFACCNDINCPNNWGACQGWGATALCANLDPTACSSIYGSVTSCGSTAPNCFQYALSDSLSASATYYSISCGVSTDTALALATVTNGGGSGAAPATAAGGATAQPSGTGTVALSTANTFLNAATSPATPGTGSGESTSGSTSSPNSSQGVQLSTGIIAVIAVAAVILIVICAVALCCIRRRYRQRIENIKMMQYPTGPGPVPYQATQGPHSVTTANWVHGQGHGSVALGPEDSVSNRG